MHPDNDGRSSILSIFDESIRKWFTETIGVPSEPQVRTWSEVAKGNNVLTVAPTGSGKTLAAFLQCIDQLFKQKQSAPAATWRPGVRILYISPLKALNNDIYRNLEAPLAGIMAYAAESGRALPEITRGVRTGDTPTEERQRMIRRPPDILITTPESLYLILSSSKARSILATVSHVIVDEIHSICGTKRGTHLALSLERLSHITASEPIRIGLSATIEPAETAAAFLGGYSCQAQCAPSQRQHSASQLQGLASQVHHAPGLVQCPSGPARYAPRRVTVARCGLSKKIDVSVASPVDDFQNMDNKPVWFHIAREVLALVRSHRSTLVFVNNRRAAEMLSREVNHLAGEKIARAHHGSVSKEVRLEIESLLKGGNLPCLIATSSLELGIDVGSIDLVIQVEAPATISQLFQRVGRAGHRLDRVSKGIIFPKTRGDLLRCVFAESEVEEGYLEETLVPDSPLDVLAQQITAATAVDEWSSGDLYDLVRCAYPYRNLTRSSFDKVLSMLADTDHEDSSRPSRPRIVWDRINDRVRATPAGKMLAVSHPGTIIDKGDYPVYLAGTNVKVGELDEEFVFESRLGDKFILGTSAWKIDKIERDRVIVSQTSGGQAKLPFWIGGGTGRPFETGLRLGRFLRTLTEKLESGEYEQWLNSVCHVSPNVVSQLRDYIESQISVASAVPTDRRIVVEHFSDEAGERRVLVHSPFGSRVHAALGLALASALKERHGCAVEYMHNDDGVLLHVFDRDADTTGALSLLSKNDVRSRLLDSLTESPAFAMTFRYCAARSLLLTRPGKGRFKRFPGWMQRLRGGELLTEAAERLDHPVVIEAFKECLSSVFDLDHLEELLERIEEGNLEVFEVKTLFPSPFGSELLFSFLGNYMYIGDLPRAERRGGLLVSDFSVFGVPSGTVDYESLDPRAIRDLTSGSTAFGPSSLSDISSEIRFEVSRNGKPDDGSGGSSSGHDGPFANGLCRVRNSDELHRYLQLVGPIPAVQASYAELDRVCNVDSLALLRKLEAEGRACRLVVPQAPEPRWIAAEDFPVFCSAFGIDMETAELLVSAANGAATGEGVRRVPASSWLSGYALSRRPCELDAVTDLVRRYVRASGPFCMADLLSRYPVSETTALAVLERLVSDGDLVVIEHWAGTSASRWCSTRMYEKLRATTMKYAREDMKPRRVADLCEYLFDKQRVVPARVIHEHSELCKQGWQNEPSRRGRQGEQHELFPQDEQSLQPCDQARLSTKPAHGDDSSLQRLHSDALDRLESVIRSLAGIFAPLQWWEEFILPVRVSGYSPYHLDELCATGRIRWVGRMRGATKEIGLFHADDFFDLYVPDSTGTDSQMIGDDHRLQELSVTARSLLDVIRATGSPSLTDLGKITGLPLDVVWDSLGELLFRAAICSNQFTPVRIFSHSEPIKTVLSRPNLLAKLGRWSVVASLIDASKDVESALDAICSRILRRYGFICKETFEAECSFMSWREAYSHLDLKEMKGELIRGYFISGISGVQFSHKDEVDRLRTPSQKGKWVVVNACDPAVPYRLLISDCQNGLNWARTESTALVFYEGEVVLVASSFGSRLSTPEIRDGFTDISSKLKDASPEADGAQGPRKHRANLHGNDAGLPDGSADIDDSSAGLHDSDASLPCGSIRRRLLCDALGVLSQAFLDGKIWQSKSGMTVRMLNSISVRSLPEDILDCMAKAGYASDYDGLTVWRGVRR